MQQARKLETLQYLEYLKRVESEKCLSEKELDRMYDEYNHKVNEAKLAKNCDFHSKRKAFEMVFYII